MCSLGQTSEYRHRSQDTRSASRLELPQRLCAASINLDRTCYQGASFLVIV
jgi:hypothetical protein